MRGGGRSGHGSDGTSGPVGPSISPSRRPCTFTLEPAQVIFVVEHYRGHIPDTVLDIADRFFQLHASQATNLSGHGFQDARVLGRLVISIYDSSYRPETPTSPLASRALDLIDAMILARTYELEERLAQLDR